jgi:hypothetical protein
LEQPLEHIWLHAAAAASATVLVAKTNAAKAAATAKAFIRMTLPLVDARGKSLGDV